MRLVELRDVTRLLTCSAWCAAIMWVVILAGNLFVPSEVRADQYRVTMSENDTVCEASRLFFTDYVELLHKRFPDLISIGWRPTLADILIREKHAEFSIIDWTEVQLLEPALQDMKGGEITQSSVDIDNDGQLDVVVRIRWRLRGVPTDTLAIFEKKKSPLDGIREFSLDMLDQAESELDFTARGYRLKKAAGKAEREHGGGRTIGAFELVPFRLNGTTYISITNPYRSEDKDWNRWRVIAKYTGSPDLEDVCYLKRVQQETSKPRKRK
jgi:hypothetical protein